VKGLEGKRSLFVHDFWRGILSLKFSESFLKRLCRGGGSLYSYDVPQGFAIHHGYVVGEEE
jgi:hypothetical protein